MSGGLINTTTLAWFKQKLLGVVDDKLAGKQNSGECVTSLNGARGDVTLKDYVTGLSVSGKTVTYTKKDGTSGTITTRDTTYSAGAGISLSGTTFSNSGVRSIAAGSSANVLIVNTNGTTTTITINNVANAGNATKATKDGEGNVIATTYAKPTNYGSARDRDSSKPTYGLE